jgi:hypothetical protein
MKYIQVYDNNSIAVFDHDSIPEFAGVDPRFIFYPEGRDDIVSGWFYESGEFSAPPAPVQQYKTKGLDQIEYRSLLTPIEAIKNDKARANINGDMSWLTGGVVGIDDVVDETYAAILGEVFLGVSYRDLLRSVYRAFDDSVKSGIDMDNPTVMLGANIQALLALLDAPERVPIILLGKPL